MDQTYCIPSNLYEKMRLEIIKLIPFKGTKHFPANEIRLDAACPSAIDTSGTSSCPDVIVWTMAIETSWNTSHHENVIEPMVKLTMITIFIINIIIIYIIYIYISSLSTTCFPSQSQKLTFLPFNKHICLAYGYCQVRQASNYRSFQQTKHSAFKCIQYVFLTLSPRCSPGWHVKSADVP